MRPQDKTILISGTHLFAIVDSDIFDELTKYKWHLTNSGYAVRQKYTNTIDGVKKYKKIYMHKVVMNGGEVIDHINGNKLDNRKNNLRSATYCQNSMNSTRRTGKSNYRGVGYATLCPDRPWTARITVNKKRIFLGNFSSETEAAMAYDIAAKKHFPDFARTNL